MASSGAVHQSQPSASITDVDVRVYAAARSGDILDVFEERRHDLVNFLTPNKNTVLHLNITASGSDDTDFVERVLALCPALLQQPNAKGETPLHLAARYGRFHVAKLLVEHAKADVEAARLMLRAANGEGDSALHEAVRFRHLGIVKLLTEEDPEFSFRVNKAGETPLYIACERKYTELVAEMLDNCTSPASSGPCGRTALHAATISNDQESTETILRKIPCLTRTRDDNGWTPLHYAVDLNYSWMVRTLLESDGEAVYVKDIQGRTALHVAALCGYHKILRELLACRPGCSELVDNQGCNILHSAVEGDNRNTVALILDDPLLSHLIFEKNKDGNTPLHHAATHLRHISLGILTDCKRRRRVDKQAFNNENKNIRDIFATDIRFVSEKAAIKWGFALLYRVNVGRRILDRKAENINWELDDRDPRKEDDDGADDPLLSMIEKTREACIVAAVLIATVTFAAGFSLPGGYVSDNGPLHGTAVLRHSAAFKAFVVSNSVAMVFSSLAVLLHLNLTTRGSMRESLINNFVAAATLTISALTAMILAFATGTYAVLAHSGLFAYAACALGLSFFLLYCIMAYLHEIKLRNRKTMKRIYYKRT